MKTILGILYIIMILLPLHAADEAVAKLPRNLLTNEGIVILADAGFDEAFLADLIAHRQTRFDTSVEGLAYLANHGISERIIRIMLANENKPADATPSYVPVSTPAVVPVEVVRRKILVPASPAVSTVGTPAVPAGPLTYWPLVPGNPWYIVNPAVIPAMVRVRTRHFLFWQGRTPGWRPAGAW